jgi:sugar phosphate permease
MSEKTSSSRAWLSGIGGILMTAVCLVPFSMFSLYIQPICNDLSVGVGQVSIASSLWTVGCFISAFFVGKLYEKVNTKVLVALGAITVFFFQFTISVSTSLVLIYIGAFLNGVGAMWCGMAMAQIIISKWFVKKQGTMMSLCMVVTTLVAAVMFMVAGGMVQSVGYRTVTLIIGIVAGVLGIVAALLVSGEPSKYGMKPYGAEEGGGEDVDASAVAPSLSWGKVIKSPVFWAILVICAFGGFVAQGFNAQGAVILGSFGIDSGAAAGALSIFTLAGMFTVMGFGMLCDKIGPKNAMTIFAVIVAVVLLLAFMWTGWIGAVVFAIGMAFVSPISSLYGPNIAPRIFGPGASGDMIGIINVCGSIGSTLGPICLGFVYDAMGTYTLMLEIMGAMIVLTMLLNFWLNKKSNLDKVQQQIADEAAAAEASE